MASSISYTPEPYEQVSSKHYKLLTMARKAMLPLCTDVLYCFQAYCCTRLRNFPSIDDDVLFAIVSCNPFATILLLFSILFLILCLYTSYVSLSFRSFDVFEHSRSLFPSYYFLKGLLWWSLPCRRRGGYRQHWWSSGCPILRPF